jgi:hypothetical protein
MHLAMLESVNAVDRRADEAAFARDFLRQRERFLLVNGQLVRRAIGTPAVVFRFAAGRGGAAALGMSVSMRPRLAAGVRHGSNSLR